MTGQRQPFVCECGNGMFTIDIAFPDTVIKCRECGEEIHGMAALFRRWRQQKIRDFVAGKDVDRG